MRALTTFVLAATALLSLLAADPQQPKVGTTPVINATNGFGGILTVRTQVNVGYAGQQGIITIASTNDTYSTTLTVDASGFTDVQLGGTNMVQVGQRGELFVGNQASLEWAGLSQLAVENDVSSGDPLLQRVNFESIDSSSLNNYAGQYLKSDSTPAAVFSQILLEAVQSSTSSDATLAMQAGHGTGLFLRMDESGQNLVTIAPGGADGSTAYTFNTKATHTTGSLAEFKNNGTQELELDANGTLLLFFNGSSSVTTLQEGAAVVQAQNIGSANPSSSFGFLAENTWQATSGSPQNSPSVTWSGEGWSTNNAASEQVLFSSYVVPSSGAAHPTGQLNFRYQITSTNVYNDLMSLDTSTTSGDTRLLLYDVAAGTLVRVSRGAADSGGTGFRVLRIPN